MTYVEVFHTLPLLGNTGMLDDVGIPSIYVSLV